MNAQQERLAALALTTFRLNGQFLALAEELARPVGLTAARWQVLGALLQEPLTVSDIARAMGITRQSVQRIADVLVADGLAAYADNPQHKRAKLVVLTDAGREAVDRISPAHARRAADLHAALGARALDEAVAALAALSEGLDALVS